MSKDITDELIIREETSGYSFEKSKSDMEEDIKTLERMLKIEKECLHYDVSQDEIRAIEHLIKAYKELEEKVMQKDLEIIGVEEYTKASMGEIIEHYYTANEDCISKSLVEEKIEEYQNNMKLYENETHNIFNENNIRQEVITVLQELLEKGK